MVMINAWQKDSDVVCLAMKRVLVTHVLDSYGSVTLKFCSYFGTPHCYNGITWSSRS